MAKLRRYYYSEGLDGSWIVKVHANHYKAVGWRLGRKGRTNRPAKLVERTIVEVPITRTRLERG